MLGSNNFIEFIKEKYLSGKKEDKNVPALKELSKKTTLEEIFDETGKVFKIQPALARNVKMYLSQRYSGMCLKEIGKHFEIGESGVSQASRRIALRLKKEKKLREQIGMIEKKLGLSRMKT